MFETGRLNTYQQWMDCFEHLRSKVVTDEFVESLKMGSCPGIDSVMPQFLNRIQDTVSDMLNRYIKGCTKALNASLEEGDYSNIESILYRSHKQMKRCCFYRNIQFIPASFVRELDERTVSELNRYWKELSRSLEELAEETNNENVYDIQYYTNRLINKDRYDG